MTLRHRIMVKIQKIFDFEENNNENTPKMSYVGENMEYNSNNDENNYEVAPAHQHTMQI